MTKDLDVAEVRMETEIMVVAEIIKGACVAYGGTPESASLRGLGERPSGQVWATEFSASKG